MLERLRAFQGDDQLDLFGPAPGPTLVRRALAALRRWLTA